VFYRIIDNEDDDGRPPTITIRERRIYIISHTMYYSRPIPAGGLLSRDILDLRRRLDNRYTGPWIATQLNHSEYRGVAGPLVARLAETYNVNLNHAVAGYRVFTPINRINVNPVGRAEVMRMIQAVLNDRPAAVGNAQTRSAHAPSMIAVDALPADYTCIVCLLTSTETPGDEWVTADGCALHMFHRKCMRPWTRGNCMTCRRELK
jgi:hypothetical protein